MEIIAENIDTPMPLYQCHKKVRALKIAKVEYLSDIEPGPALLRFEGSHAAKQVDTAFSARMRASNKDCGYFVVYEDGYESWSPTKAFEDGYTRIEG